jgi:radical SAM protein with 4Fe4S-binding SPASM domain
MMSGLAARIVARLKRIRDRRRPAIGGSFDINLLNQVFIEPCFNACNLRCPYCPVGQGLRLRDMARGMMPFDLFKRILAKSFTHYHGAVGLYNWGEPFLNPDLPGMVRHVKQNSRARLVLNSNFSFRFDDRIAEILECLEGDRIIISCDGFSQEICEKYRVGVDFSLVMHNIELINGHKKPQTELLWQYLKFPWNPHESEAAEAFCKQKGIGFYTGEGGISPHYPMLPAPRPTSDGTLRCDFFRDALTINFDGEVYPCCAYYGPPTYSLGNAAKESLKEIFSRGKGRKMLDYLLSRSGGDDGVFCKHCVERDAGLLESWTGDL